MSFKEQNPTVTLASNGHPPPDVESADAVSGELPKKEENRTKCVLYVLLFAILQTGVILIFALVIMKVQTPKFRLRSATLADRQVANGSFTGRITAEVSIKNNNFGKYKYGSTRVAFYYNGSEIGAGEVKDSSVNWKSTKKVEMTAKLDLGPAAGVMRVESRGRMEGKVAMVFVIKRNRSTAMDCAMDIDTGSGEIANVACE